MKPPSFEYHQPATVRDALELLAEFGDDAVVLAGGQSLLPMLNLRLSRPGMVIDIGRIDGLAQLDAVEDGVSLGTMATHRQIEVDPVVARLAPLAQRAASYIGYRAIRNRGTIGGSVAHADPAAEWPAVVLALDGSVTVESTQGTRTVGGEDFFESYFTTAKRSDELVMSVQLAGRFNKNWGFSEFQRRTGDFAAVAVAVACVVDDAEVREARVVLAGVAERPIRCPAAEEALLGGSPDDVRVAAQAASEAFDPASESHGSTDFRKRLIFAETLRAATHALGHDNESSHHA